MFGALIVSVLKNLGWTGRAFGFKGASVVLIIFLFLVLAVSSVNG